MLFFKNKIISGLILTAITIMNIKAADTDVKTANSIKDDFLEDTNRAKLFKKTDFNVPDIYIKLSEEDLKALVDSASAGGFGGPGGPGRPGRRGNSTEGDFPPPPGGGFGGPGRRGNSTEGDFPPPPPGGGFGGPGGPGGRGNSTEGDFPPPPPPGNFSMGPGFPFPGQEEDEFKVEDASLEFVLDGEKTTVDSITISVGGQFSKNSPKLGYNIKCNSGNLFGRKVFRLRSNVDDLTLMRAKLSCDVLNRLGLPSVSANYARLFFNGEFMGFYVLLDAYKTSWIKKVYEDEEVTDLYQCKQMNSDFSENNVRLCVNANNDYTNSTESLEEFITSINSAKSRKDVEDFMNVDVFVKVWIYEWLLGSWDHTLVNGKNYFLYKQVTGKWDLFIYDFDSMFGQNLRMFMRNSDNPATVPFDGWYKNRYIVDVLAKNDNSTFTKNLQEIVDKAFNPDVIFPHIDAIKSWITPYIKEDRTPVNGTLPGYINDKARGGFGGPGGPDSNNGHTFEEFDQNVEYTTLGSGIGIKKWIQDRYDYVCKNYKIKCHSTTKTNSTTTEVNPETSVNSTVDVSTATIDDTEETDVPTTIYPDTSEETTTEYEVTTTKANATTSVATTSPATPTITETPSKDEDENKDNEDSTCWSKSQGYSCCKTCNVYYVDKSGSWGVENGKWCGIKSDVCKIKVDRNCWSSGYGYSCCKTCKIYYTDDIGEWGIENGQWCGIVDSRCGINDDDNGVINGWNWNKKHNSATQGRNTNKWNNKNNHGNWGWGWGWRW